MITKDNLRQTLLALDFNHKKDIDIYFKEYETFDCEIKVDFKNENIEYPERVVVNDKTTSNFSHPENFVVLECVNRLLEKGYRPEHIELEPRWKLGRDAKGGKADICVHNKDGENLLLIIECKTAGQEHRKELNNMKADGGQLFSYWQQERSVKWLSLYSSDYKDDEVFFENYIINCSDDEEVKKLAKKDSSIKLYEHAKSVQDLFEVWDETYDKQILPKGVIFGENSQAYQIGIPPLRKKNLVDFDREDKIVNRFEEILRHNNVSDKENAFNRLVALFICKLVDEIQKTDEDEVDFQYKVGSDTYETLQDRLQRLHKEGMEKFMGEEIFYVPDDYAENLFATKLNSKNRKAAIDDLRNTIRILKFYSNNDFAFKDVHNEQLFYQNGKILVEVVQLFEHYRIVYPNKNQILGDLFEQLLNKGFKQNEGQFFTPTPIARFIWDCLPLGKIIQQKSGYIRPRIIDYACGAGHFLTEAIEAVNAFFVASNKEKFVADNQWVEHSIYGIEKDYRLARVAKVSLYMNGAGSGNIKFGDGLEQYVEEKIKNSSFDILVANPPYSVRGFKPHLKLKNNSFETLQFITNDGKEIETLFVERINQLLKPNGIAAVILPESILSNPNDSFVAARENLLQNFQIHAVVQLGKKTFGATPASTFVIFLEKYNEPPKKKDLAQDCVKSILNSQMSEDWGDDEIFNAYSEKIRVKKEDYQKFIKEMLTYEEIQSSFYFSQYLTHIKGLSSDDFSKRKKEFFSYTKKKEYEKLFYFALIYNQNIVLITAPTNIEEQKKFLGYEWSDRIGQEGLQETSPGGMLYNKSDRFCNTTLASLIRSQFDNSIVNIPKHLEKYYTIQPLHNAINFTRINFNKVIDFSNYKRVQIKSSFDKQILNKVALIDFGTRITKKESSGDDYPVYGGGGETFRHNEYNRSDCFVIARFGMSRECVRFVEGKFFLNDSGLTVKTKNETLLSSEYLNVYLFMMQSELFLLGRGSGQKNLDMDEFKSFVIPIPPQRIQKSILSEYKLVADVYKNTRMTLEEYKSKLFDVFYKYKVLIKDSE